MSKKGPVLSKASWIEKYAKDLSKELLCHFENGADIDDYENRELLLNLCIISIRDWVNENSLKLPSEKEFNSWQCETIFLSDYGPNEASHITFEWSIDRIRELNPLAIFEEEK